MCSPNKQQVQHNECKNKLFSSSKMFTILFIFSETAQVCEDGRRMRKRLKCLSGRVCVTFNIIALPGMLFITPHLV